MASRWCVAFAACAAITLAAIGLPARADEAPTLAADPAMETRVMAIAAELRCLVCQNETLAASQSALAIDLKKQIEKQLASGASAQQVRDYMVERYGEFVLFRPALHPSTALLWFGPFLLLAGVAIGWWRLLRRNDRSPLPIALSTQERERARKLLRTGAGLP